MPLLTPTSTVEYFDPHDVYKLLAPGLIPRLPLHNLHWQSHAGPLRSIDSLHIDLVRGDSDSTPPPPETPTTATKPADTDASRDDGFQTQAIGGQTATPDTPAEKSATGKFVGPRRHQIPGLRHTPYLKVLFVRCDDNDSYKSTVRTEIREWLKTNTPPSSGSKKASNQENHDAYEWLIVHVVLPNTAAATQQRSSSKSEGSVDKSATSRWRPGTTPLLEKLKSDFNSSSKGSPDHIAQIRIGINDVPYDLLPRVVPAVPTGYSESEQDAEKAWDELMTKLKSLILSSFDQRVTQYEDDIKERDGQRTLPGWNFCTFFILKEGLARGFENVGLVEDALVGYDELNVGLDLIVSEQQNTDSPESHGGALLNYTDELRDLLQTSLQHAGEGGDENEAVDFAAQDKKPDAPDQIPISPIKKAYRDMILENKVSVFDFRCYIFSRQIALLLRLANTSFTREQLLSRLKEQQESILHGVAPLAKATPQKEDETEDLNVLAEICKRALEFIPAVTAVMRHDLIASLNNTKDASKATAPSKLTEESIDNIVVSFAFSVTQQILAQTATKSLPIPPSSLSPSDGGHEPKSIIPEPKTMMHPARNSSLNERSPRSPRLPQSPSFPGPGQALPPSDSTQFLKPGLEDLAAGRAELYLMSRNILRNLGQKRGWTNGWDAAPIINDSLDQMEEISLDDKDTGNESEDSKKSEYANSDGVVSTAGIQSHLLSSAIDNSQDFYRLYETLTDKAMRHYIVASQEHAVETSLADLAVMRYRLKRFREAAEDFERITRFFGGESWSMIELSLLIMFADCVQQTQSTGDYVYVALKLLTMACAAEKAHRNSSLVGRSTGLDLSPVKDVVSQLLEASSSLKNDAKAPIVSFFDKVQLIGTPTYDDDRDSCNITVSLHSLLPDDLLVDHIKLHATNTDDSAVIREVLFESTSSTTLKPGKNTFEVKCNSVIPGHYTIGNMSMRCGKILLLYEKNSRAVPSPEYFLKHREVILFQRANALDVSLSAAKHTTHDGSNSLDLTIHTGWNNLQRCEVRIKPATGGLRLLTTESTLLDSELQFSKPPEAGLFIFDAIADNSSTTIQFPFSVETDLRDVLAKVEVKYTTSAATFTFAKNFTIPVSLVLGVNVQDVFKHQALFSRFNVSTSIDGPLRLYKSELLSTELYESSFGASPKNPLLVFPKQPAHLLYKVHRTAKTKTTTKGAKVMYLKLHYRTIQDEIEHLICQSIQDALTPTTQPYAKHILSSVTKEIKSRLQPQDLERAALLSHITTVFLNGVPWEKYFTGIGPESITTELSQFLQNWQSSQPKLALVEPTTEPPSILIPVEIPSVTIVHTADIRLQNPPSPVNNPTGPPVVTVNQVLAATLHLKWTRVWDIETTQRDDLEFSFEVTAPADAWLIGGRRKGHFVIPGRASTKDDSSLSSSPETEAEIPLVLIPLRPGWLPYPLIEIREIKGNGPGAEQGSIHGCEVDWRNLGETIQVIGDRSSVTVSLDASGPTGGPLVFESEQMQQAAGVRTVA